METRKFEITEVRADTRTAQATLSTEYPVKRFDGEEVLSHDPGAVNLSRTPLPLIVAHDGSKLPVGLVEGLRLEGQELKGVVRFSKNAEAIWNDVKDGILRNLSIGYQILEKVRTKAGYVAKKWMPYECSLVAAGADPKAGIGRKLIFGGARMDKNDLLKERKKATDEMIEMAGKADLSSEDKERFDRIKDAVEGYDRRLEALEDVEKYKKDEFKVPDTGTKRDLSFEGGPAQDASYRSMFGEPAQDEDEMSRFRAQMVEGTPSLGGFSVPEPLAAKWLDQPLPDEIVRPRATVWPMESNTRKVIGWDGNTQSSNLFGGFAMEFISETGTGNKQTGKLRTIELTAHKGGIFVDASSEVVADGLGFAGQIEAALKKSIAQGMEKYFLSSSGSGAGCPLSIINDGTLISVPKESGQAADTLKFSNVCKMFKQMYPGGRNDFVWVANHSCIEQLIQGMNVAIGTGGSWVNVFSEKDGSFSLLGRPVLFSSHLPTLGDANDLIAVSLKNYAIGIRKGLKIQRSDIPSWTEDLVSWRVLIRFDGQGTWGEVLSVANGDDMSWVVGLAERA